MRPLEDAFPGWCLPGRCVPRRCVPGRCVPWQCVSVQTIPYWGGGLTLCWIGKTGIVVVGGQAYFFFKCHAHTWHSFYLFCIFLTRHTLIQYSSSGWTSSAGYLPELGINSCVWVNNSSCWAKGGVPGGNRTRGCRTASQRTNHWAALHPAELRCTPTELRCTPARHTWSASRVG